MTWKDVYSIKCNDGGWIWWICNAETGAVVFNTPFDSYSEAAAHAASWFRQQNEKIDKILLD